MTPDGSRPHAFNSREQKLRFDARYEAARPHKSDLERLKAALSIWYGRKALRSSRNRIQNRSAEVSSTTSVGVSRGAHLSA
jgi:hypothetical protein